jgi:hypothetical protein
MKVKINALNKNFLVEFKNDEQFIEFVTKHNNQIKSLDILNEETLPALEKPVEMVKISEPTGWVSLEKSAFVTKEKSVEKKGMTLGGKYGEFKYEPNKNLDSATTDKVSDTETESPALKGEEPKASSVEDKQEASKTSFKKSTEPKEESEDKEEDEKEDLEEGFKDNLKKAGKYVKGAVAGAAMAGALANGAQASTNNYQFDPYYDGAQRPYENVETVQDAQHPFSWEEILKSGKPVTINGHQYSVEELKKTQKENNFSDEEMNDLVNGEDPYGEGVRESVEKPTMDDVDFEDDLTDADREMYTSEVQHILDMWEELSTEEQKELKKLMFNKSEKETLNEKGCLEEYNHPMIGDGSVNQETSNDNEYQVNSGDVYMDADGNELTVDNVEGDPVDDNIGGKGRIVHLSNTAGEKVQMPSSILYKNFKRKDEQNDTIETTSPITESSDDEDYETYNICSWCGEEFPISDMRKEKDMGYLCHQCIKGIESRESNLEFEE